MSNTDVNWLRSLDILGGTNEYTPKSPPAQKESQQKKSLRERIKSAVRKIGCFIKWAVSFVKNDIVPIASVVATVINAVSNYSKNNRCATCAV